MKRRFLSLLTAFLLAIPMAADGADGFIMQEARMMIYNNGQTVPMNNEVIMADGTKVMPNGTVLRSDGKKLRIVNGMMIDLNGVVLPKNGVMMKGGKMITVKDGDILPMTSEVQMSNGVKVTTDGTIMTNMKEGDMMMPDGTIKTVKVSLKDKQAGSKDKPGASKDKQGETK